MINDTIVEIDSTKLKLIPTADERMLIIGLSPKKEIMI